MSLLTIPATYQNGVLHSNNVLPDSRWKVLVTFLEEESPESNNDTSLAYEEAVFATMHAQLKERYFGEYVAIVGDSFVDHDKDLAALSRRVYEKLGNRPILLTLVNDEIERKVNVPSIRLLNE